MFNKKKIKDLEQKCETLDQKCRSLYKITQLHQQAIEMLTKLCNDEDNNEVSHEDKLERAMSDLRSSITKLYNVYYEMKSGDYNKTEDDVLHIMQFVTQDMMELAKLLKNKESDHCGKHEEEA